MQVEIVRHDRRAQDADRQNQRARLGQARQIGHRAGGQRGAIHPHDRQLHAKAQGDRGDQAQHDRFKLAKAMALETQDDQRIEPGEQHACPQRHPQQEMQRQCGTQHFGNVGGNDRQFGQQPQHAAGGGGIVAAGQLGEILATRQAHPHRQRLQHDRRQPAGQHHEQQAMAELRSRGDIGGPVARVHIAHGHQQAGPGRLPQHAPPRALAGHGHGAAHLGGAERGRGGGGQRKAAGQRRKRRHAASLRP